MATSAASWEGTLLSSGRYEIVGKLGEGGMGSVFRAHDHNLDTDVVIKVPHPLMLRQEEFARRFQREIRSLVQLSHPHIVKILDVGDHNGIPFAVMQFLAGGSLEERCPVSPDGIRQPMRIGPATQWLPDVARALDFIHRKGYVHRDIKPPNILFDDEGNAYISDFGVAKVVSQSVEADRNLTATGMILGTVDFMAPEVMRGHAYDGKADQYSLAVTVFQLLTGQSPFAPGTPAAVLIEKVTKKTPTATSLVSDVLPAISDAVQRAMAIEPAQRFATCEAFASAISEQSDFVPPAPVGRPDVVAPPKTTVSGNSVTVAQSPTKPPRRDTVSGDTISTRASKPTGPAAAPPLPKRQPASGNRKVVLTLGSVVFLAVVFVAYFIIRAQIWPVQSPSSPDNAQDSHIPTNSFLAKLSEGRFAKLDSRNSHTGYVRTIAFYAGGTRAMSGCSDGELKIWNLVDGTEEASLRVDNRLKDADYFAISPNGDRVIAGDQSQYQLWNLEKRSKIYDIRVKQGSTVAFLPDGERFLVAGYKSPVLFRLGEAGASEIKEFPEVSTQCRCHVVTPSGKYAATGHTKDAKGGMVVLWDVDNAKPLKITHTGNDDYVQEIDITPDGSTIVASDMDGCYLVKDGKLVWTKKNLEGCKFISGSQLLVGIDTYDLVIVEAGSGREIHRVDNDDFHGNPRRLAVSPDGKFTLIATTEGNLVLWRLPNLFGIKQSTNRARDDPFGSAGGP